MINGSILHKRKINKINFFDLLFIIFELNLFLNFSKITDSIFFIKIIKICNQYERIKQDFDIKNYMIKYFADINLINVKTQIFSLPYENIGVEIIDLFQKNFQVIQNLLNKIFNFNAFEKAIEIFLKEISEIDEGSFNNINNFQDLKIELSLFFFNI